jgi:uncharacterized protein (DUF302 family)
MSFIRNLLALLGLITLVIAGYAYQKANTLLSQFDPDALSSYQTFVEKVLETKDPGQAMVYSVKVNEGLSPEDVKESLKSLAVSKNFLFIGESPFYKQYEAVTGKKSRYISFMSFCDVRVGAMMANYNPLYTSFMPCRIALVEHQDGQLWLHSMSLEMMIKGGKPLPPELKSEALRVWSTIQEIMQGGANGDF